MRAAALLLAALLLAPPAGATAQTGDAAQLLGHADAAFRAGDTAAARAGYEAVLRVEPDNSRAVYQLALLLPAGAADRIRLLRRYTALEPADAWGHVALGEAYEHAGEEAAAREAYATALALAPGDAEIRAAHARLDARARRGRLAFAPGGRMTGDSDRNRTARAEISGAITVADGMSVGLAAAHVQVTDGVANVSGWEGVLTGEWQPDRALLVLARAGALAVSDDAGASAHEPIVHARLRWRPERGPAADVRVRHEPLTGTPRLLATPVVLSEGRAVVELPVLSALHARGHARHGRLRADVEANTRTSFGGGPVLRLTPALELNASGTRLSYARPSAAGYFAPRQVDALDAGLYLEHYGWWPLTLALDIGAGAERVTRFGAPAGGWQPALRLWSQLSREFARGGELRLELEAYETQTGEVPEDRPGAWRWGALAFSVHLRP
jgi:hypothetical protein